MRAGRKGRFSGLASRIAALSRIAGVIASVGPAICAAGVPVGASPADRVDESGGSPPLDVTSAATISVDQMPGFELEDVDGVALEQLKETVSLPELDVIALDQVNGRLVGREPGGELRPYMAGDEIGSSEWIVRAVLGDRVVVVDGSGLTGLREVWIYQLRVGETTSRRRPVYDVWANARRVPVVPLAVRDELSVGTETPVLERLRDAARQAPADLER